MSNKIMYYTRGYLINNMPSLFYKWNYERLKKYESQCDKNELAERLKYYFKLEKPFSIPEEAAPVKNFEKTAGTGYYLDFKEFLHYFKGDTWFAYKFGDITEIMTYPCLMKARSLEVNNDNNIIFKLNKFRHFQWVEDELEFREKKDSLVWRGGAYQPNRIKFVKEFYNRPSFNVGQTNEPVEQVPWQKPKMSISDQLQYKFIFCPEGNDVATNLKWAMSSNSLCLMPKPSCETWFMEGILQPNLHYVEVKDDFSDIEDKMDYFIQHPDLAEEIIRNAHDHVSRFQNQNMEDLLCLKTLELYSQYSGQLNARKYDTAMDKITKKS